VKRVLGLTAAILVIAAVPAAATPVVGDLGWLPGSTQASAFDVNDAGLVVGTSLSRN
jgi:hypothetical protein